MSANTHDDAEYEAGPDQLEEKLANLDEELADRRSQLTLQLAIMSERKLAKLISLVEEQRRDNFLLEKREDPEANELAKPVDLAASLDRIEAVHRGAT